MTRRFGALVFICILICSAAAATQNEGAGGGVDLDLSSVSRAYTGPEPLTLLCVPDGSGEAFFDAYLPFGGTADATLTLTLRDISSFPIANFPVEDMWIEAMDGGLSACVGGTNADRNTDANGETVWQQPLRAGGWSEQGCLPVVNGSFLLANPVGVNFVSPDLNGDLNVNLTDLGMFATDFYTIYSPRSDLRRDGIINLSDIGEFARHYVAACP